MTERYKNFPKSEIKYFTHAIAVASLNELNYNRNKTNTRIPLKCSDFMSISGLNVHYKVGSRIFMYKTALLCKVPVIVSK